MSVIDNSNLGTLWNRILGLFTARKINNKSLAKDITINDEDIPSTAVSGETTVEGALGNLVDQISDQSQQISNLEPVALTGLTSAYGNIITNGCYRFKNICFISLRISITTTVPDWTAIVSGLPHAIGDSAISAQNMTYADSKASTCYVNMYGNLCRTSVDKIEAGSSYALFGAYAINS